jgi:histidinol dehydrogenase
MTVIRLTELGDAALQRMLNRANTRIFDAEILGAAQRAIADIRARGDDALLEYTSRYDRVVLTRAQLVVRHEEIERARTAISADLHDALVEAITRTRRFNERVVPSGWLETLEDGITAGIRFTPLEQVGVYIPAGKGRFPSTCVTIVTPAVVAGVEQISVLAPPRADGSVDPALLVACDLLGVTRIFRSNGVAGIAAFAVGTATIPAVPAIVGPGNPYVVATQLIAQTLGVRMLALLGPTEAVVLADDSADPRRLALDLLNEAEHGGDSAALLVTDSNVLADAVARLLPEYLARLPEDRRAFARAALSDYGGIVLADSMDDAVAFVNRYAPEHLQIVARDLSQLLAQIRNAGEILMGQDTPFSAGNYAIGVPAALPTGGTARSSSGITVLSFLKCSSLAALDRIGLSKVRPLVEQLGTYEGFTAHVMAVVER